MAPTPPPGGPPSSRRGPGPAPRPPPAWQRPSPGRRGADVGQIVFFRRLSRSGGEAGEGEVRTLDHVGKGYVLFGGPGQSLELGTAGVGEPRLPGELVQGVSDRDVQGLAELFDEEQ